eukprot:11921155-Alexandrium_andersonii.AAC.1
MAPNPADEALQGRTFEAVRGSAQFNVRCLEHLCMFGTSSSERLLCGVSAGRYSLSNLCRSSAPLNLGACVRARNSQQRLGTQR